MMNYFSSILLCYTVSLSQRWLIVYGLIVPSFLNLCSQITVNVQGLTLTFLLSGNCD